jgi:hypothetical protein
MAEEIVQENGQEIERHHIYHAESTALSGHIQLPIEQHITPHAFIKVAEKGGYLAQQALEYRLETVISYGRAHTQVSGHKEIKPGRGWNSLTTAVVENVNILNIITADRVVAQIATEHPLEGYVPRISFLGSHFQNLRIAGHPVEVDLDLTIVGPKPANDAPYTKDPDFIDRIGKQHARLREHPSAMAEILKLYNRVPESFANAQGSGETVECSLVHNVGGSFPGHTCGHVIHIPDFGTVYLAKVRIEHDDPHPKSGIPQKTTVSLDMVHAEMGCIATGTATVASGRLNGMTAP